jgi:hypothetical protein
MHLLARRSLSLAALCGATFAASACGADGPFGDLDSWNPLQQQALEADALEARVVGTYASQAVTTQKVATGLPIFDTINISGGAYSTVTIAREGDAFTYTETPCAIQFWGLPPGGAASIAPAAIQDAGTLTTSVTFSGDDELSFQTGEIVAVVGADLADPARDPLPTSPTDATVTNPDGHAPGVELNVSAKALFVTLLDGSVSFVQRNTYAVAGTTSDDGFTGALTVDTETSILSATDGRLRSVPDQDNDADPAGNTVTIRKTDALLTCQELIAQSGDLF